MMSREFPVVSPARSLAWPSLELYFSDKRNFLVVFKDKRERQGIVTKLQYKTDQAGVISRSFIGNFVLDQVVRAIEKPGQDLDALTRKWQTREISNASLPLVEQLQIILLMTGSSPTCHC